MPKKEVKKTIAEWEKEFGVVILDADGFDRTDKKLYERKFTAGDFEFRLMNCTIQPSMKFYKKYVPKLYKKYMQNVV
jgi:hypothetical protein